MLINNSINVFIHISNHTNNMVNKCSVTGCKSLYIKSNVKLHRFPLTNPATLPTWIAATGREKEWTPCKSSRLCGNHFQESEYIVGHGKGVLKPTAIPTIEYRVENPKYSKRKYNRVYEEMAQMDRLVREEPMGSETNFEIVQLNYNDIYDTKYEQDKDKTDLKDEHSEEPYYTNEDKEIQNIIEATKVNENLNSCYDENDCDNDDNNLYIDEDENSLDETEINECENSDNEARNDICNRENQCYMFTSSFREDEESIETPTVEKPLEESSNKKIDQLTADSSFNKILALKRKKQRRTKDIYSLYFKSLKKRNKHKKEPDINFYNDDTGTFSAFIEDQMKELRPCRKLYLTTKHKIQKVLMRAQLKLETLASLYK